MNAIFFAKVVYMYIIMFAPPVPNVEVRFEHLNYKIKETGTVSNARLPSVGRTLCDMALARP